MSLRGQYLTYSPLSDDLQKEVVEIPLLLSLGQAEALETAAHSRGQTAAAVVRYLVHDFLISLDRPNGSAAVTCPPLEQRMGTGGQALSDKTSSV
jgi:hypothetical protein